MHLPPSSHVSLSQLRPPQEAIIERVEAADPDLLRYLGTLGLTPQAQVTALEYSPFDGNLRLNIHGQAQALVLGPGVTRHIRLKGIHETTFSTSNIKSGDADTVQAATDVLTGRSNKGKLAKLLPFLGPAFIASVAYVDPGNFATNIQGGAQFGYLLLWVILVSNLMAMLVQSLSAKLGIATGMNLAEQCRANFPRPMVVFMSV